MQEQKNDGEYFVVIRESSGRYVSEGYKNKKEFDDSIYNMGRLLIAKDISREDAEKKCRDFNDSHFPLPGLEKFMD